MSSNEGIPGFKETLDTMYDTMLKKNADYAGLDDPFGNFMQVEKLGITTAEKGILVRITDKLARVTNLLDAEAQVKDEAITDTLQDMSNYAVILKCLIEQKQTHPEHGVPEYIRDKEEAADKVLKDLGIREGGRLKPYMQDSLETFCGLSSQKLYEAEVEDMVEGEELPTRGTVSHVFGVQVTVVENLNDSSKALVVLGDHSDKYK